MVKSYMLTQEEADAGKKPDEAALWAGNLFSTIEYVTQVFADLRIPGIINSDSREFKDLYEKSINSFGVGFVKHGFRDGYLPGSISRNNRMLTKLDEFYAKTDWWTEDNAIGSAFTGYNKLIYGHTINAAKRNRGNIYYKAATSTD